jgi:uncharacterized protein YbjT (DUF2867 family)
MGEPTLLTGATGNSGRVIAEHLQRRGLPFVAMVRSPARRREVEALGMRAVMGDFDDPPSLDRALAGVESAYLVCTPDEKIIAREIAFIHAAKRVGVRYIVKCSALLASHDGPSQNLRSHAIVEQALLDSGLDYTILRPTGFMQTFTLFGWSMINKAGAISLPAGDGGMSLIDVRDLAAAAVLALTEPGHIGKIYDLTGAEVLTMYDIAATLERVLGRPVTYLPGTERSMDLLMRVLGVPPTPAEHVREVFRLQREHKLELLSPALQELGIRPTSYEEFARDLVAGRTGGGNSFEPPQTAVVKLLDTLMPLAMRAYLAVRGRARA